MKIGDKVEFIDITTPTELVVSNEPKHCYVEITYFNKNNEIKKEVVLKSLLTIKK